MKTPLDIKKAADLIGDHLREAGHAVPRHVALELSAKLARFRNLHQAQNAAPAVPALAATPPADRPADGALAPGSERPPVRKPTVIRVINADITTLAVDAIVNTTNSHLLPSNGVNGAIHRAAGPGLLDECLLLGGCKVGEAKITHGHRLSAKHIIHTVAPFWRGGAADEPTRLASCYRRALEVAVANGVSSIAFPSIGTGINRFPIMSAAEVAVATIRAFVGQQSTIEEVIFCCFTDASFLAHERVLHGTPNEDKK